MVLDGIYQDLAQAFHHRGALSWQCPTGEKVRPIMRRGAHCIADRHIVDGGGGAVPAEEANAAPAPGKTRASLIEIDWHGTNRLDFRHLELPGRAGFRRFEPPPQIGPRILQARFRRHCRDGDDRLIPGEIVERPAAFENDELAKSVGNPWRSIEMFPPSMGIDCRASPRRTSIERGDLKNIGLWCFQSGAST